MAHSYVSALIHYVFSTKDRSKIITPELRERLYPYMGGIARANKIQTLAIGGIEDHIHLLLALPSTLSAAKAIQLIKGGSSLWIHDTYRSLNDFAWQEGYGAFSVGISQVEKTKSYINCQPEHHRTKTFEQELVDILNKHGIKYDPRYLFG